MWKICQSYWFWLWLDSRYQGQICPCRSLHNWRIHAQWFQTKYFLNCIGALQSIIEGISSGYICLLGDFNTDFDRNSDNTNNLTSFIDDQSLLLADRQFLPPDTYTFLSSSWNSTSWLDYFLTSSEVFDTIHDMSVLYDYICSDHKPLSLSLCLGNSDSSVIGENSRGGSNNTRKCQDLSKIHPQIWGKYKSLTDQYLQNLHLPTDAILCKAMNCSNSSHIDGISDFYEEMISCLLLSREVLSNDNDTSHFKCSSVPGWNSTVKEAHHTARETFELWNNCGRPCAGNALSLMRRSRALFKYSLRSCRSQEQQK